MPLRKIITEKREYQVKKYEGHKIKYAIMKIFEDYSRPTSLDYGHKKSLVIPSVPGMEIVIENHEGDNIKTTVELKYLENTRKKDINKVKGLLKKLDEYRV